MAEDYQDRTEQPTPKRRSEARKEGRVARSRDLAGGLVMFVGLLSLMIWTPGMGRKAMEMLQLWLGQMRPGMVTPDQMPALFLNLTLTMGAMVAPVFLCISMTAIAANFVQVGSLFSFSKLAPDLSRCFQLMKGLQRIFSPKSLVELGKSLAKILLISVVAYYSIKRELPQLLPLLDQEVGQITLFLAASTFRICARIIIALVVLGMADYIYQKWDMERNLRMTKQEVKDEMRQVEGDPKVKARMKSVMRQLASKRMMADVPTADVVVTNPTHVAVALKYDNTMVAPQVVAKGKGFVAKKIIALALAAGVPRVENRELARSLYKLVDVGKSIPTTLFRAVAEVLAYVYRLRGAAGANG